MGRILGVVGALCAVAAGVWLSRPDVTRVIRKVPEPSVPIGEKVLVVPDEPSEIPIPEKPAGKKNIVAMPAESPMPPAAAPATTRKADEPVQPVERPVSMPSMVAIRCRFKDGAGNSITAFGSGVIVTSDGHILTARHVVDMDYTFRITGGRQGRGGYGPASCEAGGPPDTAHAPSVAEIRAMNPFIEVPSLPYRAEIARIPSAQSGTGMSEAEADFLDIAILRITGITAEAERYFGAKMPGTFPKSDVIRTVLPGIGEELITFGFPSGTPSYGNSFRLQGGVGTVRQYIVGDLLFADQPIGIEAEMETIGGRSGSPVFWRGRVIGIVSAKRDYSKDATIVSVYPLGKLLEGSGIVLDIP